MAHPRQGPGPAETYRAPELGKRALWTALGICLGGAILGFSLHHALVEAGRATLGETFLHVAIAFLVAGILIVALEYNAKRVTHREILRFLDLVSKDVFEALLERVVPGPVFNEIKDILHTEVIRRDCEYFITFREPYPEMPEGYFVIRRDLIFTVTNLLNRSTIFPVRSSYSSDEDPASTAWMGRQFHLRLSVNGKEVPIRPDKNLFLRNGSTVLEHPVHLEPQASARIFLSGEEPARIEAGRNTYLQGIPLIGIKVEVRNEYPEVIEVVAVQMNHPARENVQRDELGRYVLDRAFLPGQGFQVLWKRKEGPASGAGQA